MQIAIISDTHMPRGGRRLPSDCLDRLGAADLIVHAGDLCTPALLRELEAINPVVAVRGNVDDRQLQRLLPETAVLPLPGGPEVVVVHDGGPARGRVVRLQGRFPTADAVIFGHSHLPLHERAGDGFQIFNPGSPTERRRAPAHTMGLAKDAGGRIEFELVELR
ncbi:MAG TPA: metallophosphoesterase family protein [Solirubrobacteraceae bacterium]